MTNENAPQQHKSGLDMELEARIRVSEESQYALNGGIGYVGYAALHLDHDSTLDHLAKGEN